MHGIVRLRGRRFHRIPGIAGSSAAHLHLFRIVLGLVLLAEAGQLGQVLQSADGGTLRLALLRLLLLLRNGIQSFHVVLDGNVICTQGPVSFRASRICGREGKSGKGETGGIYVGSAHFKSKSIGGDAMCWSEREKECASCLYR